MRIGLSLRPGQGGTKKLLTQYGKQLVCVRYRYDERRKRRYKTVELIIEETVWQPQKKPFRIDEIVSVKVGLNETSVQEKLRRAGGRWNRAKRRWEIRYDRAVKIGLKERIRHLPAIQKHMEKTV